MKSFLNTSLAALTVLFNSPLQAADSNTETRLEPADTVYLQETISCPESFNFTEIKGDRDRKRKLKQLVAPELPTEFSDTFKIESKHIKAGREFLFNEGRITFTKNLPDGMTCTYTGGEELAEIIITVNKDPDSKKAEKDMSDFERIHSSEKPYPYKLANDRALVADTDTHIGELSCHPNQQNRWQCSIAPMFFVVVNKVSYRKLRPRKSDDKGHILLVETAGDRRNESVKPVANGQKTPPEKLYIPFTTEITAIQLQLINAKDNKELTPLCIPEGKTLDRLPMTLGTSAVIEIQGVVDKEGIVQEGTKCTMRCGNDSRTSSCWQKKTPYQYTCEWYKSAANYVAESMLWLTPPIGCWEVKDEVPKSPKEPAPADKPSDVEVVNDLDDWYADEADEADEYDPEDIRLTPEQERLKKSHFKKMVMLSAETDPFKLLGLNQTAHDVFLSAGELKRIRQKHGITEPQCSDGLFRPLCKIINHKLEEARRVLNEAKRAKDTKLDGDGDVKEEFKKICSSDANGDQYCEYVKKSELKMHNLNEL